MKLDDQTKALMLMAILLIGTVVALGFTKTTKPDDLYDKKVAAARLMEEASRSIREYRQQLDLPLDKTVDINETGLIGVEFNEITTTLGTLEAKRTAASPDTAALVVQLFSEAGVKPGDLVAVNFSSSFPGLNLAVISAAQVMELEIVSMASAGSSTWGANRPELNYIDMHQYLVSKQVFETPLRAVSLGGNGDVGKGMPDDMRSQIIDRIFGYGLELIQISNYRDNLDYRVQLYDQAGAIALFVNTGGNMVSTGNPEPQTGLILADTPVNMRRPGLLEVYLSRGVPCIQLLNVKQLAEQYNLPYDPYPLPPIGTSGIYHRTSYSLVGALAGIIAAVAGLLLIFLPKPKAAKR